MPLVEICSVCNKKLAIYVIENKGIKIHICQFCKEELESKTNRHESKTKDY